MPKGWSKALFGGNHRMQFGCTAQGGYDVEGACRQDREREGSVEEVGFTVSLYEEAEFAVRKSRLMLLTSPALRRHSPGPGHRPSREGDGP